MKLQEVIMADKRVLTTVGNVRDEDVFTITTNIGGYPDVRVDGASPRYTSFGELPAIIGKLDIDSNRFTSLVGGPTDVRYGYKCGNNLLTNLDGSPRNIPEGHFDCDNNQLASLVGGPEMVGSFYSCQNNKLTSLEGCAKEIAGVLYLANNKFTSLKNIHKHIRKVQKVFVSNNPLESHVLGVILTGAIEFNCGNSMVDEILNKHLGKGMTGVLDAQEELIDAGLEDFAQL